MSTWFTTYQLYSEEQCDQMVSLIKELDWKPGKARTPEVTELLKKNLELRCDDGPQAKEMCTAHGQRIAAYRPIKLDHIIKQVSMPKFNWYKAPGGAYNRHCDSHNMHGVRTDLACTTFLNDPDESEGGELNLEDWYGNVHSYKGKKGECVVYQCGRPHWVTPVSEGERISVICWIQSHVRDFTKRQMLANYGKTLFRLEPAMQGSEFQSEWINLSSVQGELLRMWSE